MSEFTRSVLPGHPRPLALVREAIKAALSRPVPTALITAVTAIMCVTVLMTTGRAVRAEQDVVARLDQMGTLLIALSDNQGSSGMTAASVSTLETMTGVEWAFGLDSARDAHNARLPGDGTGVPTRTFYGDLSQVVTLVSGRWPEPGEAIASSQASQQLGLLDAVGGIRFGDTNPEGYPVVGVYDADPALKALATTVLIASDPSRRADVPVLYIYVKADNIDSVDRVVDAIPSVITAFKAESATVETPQGLRDVREQISSDMAANSRYLMLATLATGLILAAVTMLAAVNDRKNDFGRRRALGASRSSIVVMVLTHAVFAGAAGALLGIAVGSAINIATGSLQPSVSFLIGLGVLAVLCDGIASLPPAVVAARRDPVRILRIP